MELQLAASSRPSSTSAACTSNRSATAGSNCVPRRRRTMRSAASGTVAAAEDLDRSGQLDQPSRQADLLRPQVTRSAAAVPELVRLPDRLTAGHVQTDLLRELGAK